MIEKLKNKKIIKMRVALTTFCNCRCPYCYVEKTNEFAKLNTLQSAISLLVESKGKKKLLVLYGGEPLFTFERAKKIILFAKKLAHTNKKRIIISFVTNMTVLKEEHLQFLKANDVHLIVSAIGIKEHHDKFRIFKNGTGTYDTIIKKVPIIWKFYEKENTGVCFNIFPDTVKFMYKNFKHLFNLGFRNFNLEIVIGYKPWKKYTNYYFATNLKKILNDLFLSIKTGDYIFLRPISLLIAYSQNFQLKRTLSNSTKEGKIFCPFNFHLYMYPDGDLTFTPFVPKKNPFIIANVEKNKVYQFENCKFSSKSNVCRACFQKYFENHLIDPEINANLIHEIYTNFCFQVANFILEKAKKNKSFAKYVDVIKKTQ